MASLSSLPLLFLLTTALTCCHVAADSSSTFGIDFHHRFSDKVREWAESHDMPATWHDGEMTPGTPEYYKALLRNDLHNHHGRYLAAGDLYSFSDGNETDLYLGHIHYALVKLGTPNQTFFVALDTGTSYFWVPCKCQSCAPHNSSIYGPNIKFNDYTPEDSTTSSAISCSSSKCDSRLRKLCTGKTTDCAYKILYNSNTSSSGIMAEDVLLLEKETAPTKLVELPITFGCGEVQTGAFLKGMAPNGLMGLGFDNMSVPTMIANNGLITDSFSMCFGRDGVGRLNFGDVGSSTQYKTTLMVTDNIGPFYNISITGMKVGIKTIKTAFYAIVDSGISYTILEDSVYGAVTTAFDSQMKDERIDNSTEQLGFEFCYQPSAGEDVLLPGINFTTKGGDPFMVLARAVGYVDKKGNLVAYCLPVSLGNINIIGEIFMTGLKLVFNREELVLGWEPFDCYGTSAPTDDSPPPEHSPSPDDSPPSPPPSPPVSPVKAWAPHVGPKTLINTMTCLIFILALLMVALP